MTHKQVKCILDVLSQAGLQPYIHAKAMTGSVYIGFGVDIGGKLRIGNHHQRSRYAYRWNLRKDYKQIDIKIKGHSCYYYPFEDFEFMVREMLAAKAIHDCGKQSLKNILKAQDENIMHKNI